MKRPYFQKKAGINTDILAIDDVRNIGFVNDKLWWAEAVGGNPGILYIRSAASLTALTVAETNHTTALLVGWVLSSFLLRNYGDIILAVASFILVANENIIITSADGGATWTKTNMLVDEIKIYDLIHQNATNITFHYQINLSIISFKDMVSPFTEYDTLALSDYDYMYPGIMRDDLYYFVLYDGSNFKKYSFDAALGANAIVLVETYTGITIPLSFNYKRQQYYFIGDVEVLVDNTHFWWRDPVKNVWQKFSVSVATDTVVAIWSENHLGEPIIPYFVWASFIIEISEKGIIKKPQALEPRDYKKNYLSNINEKVPGVVQFQNQMGNDDLSAWNNTNVTPEIIEIKDGHKNVLKLIPDSAANSFTEIDVSGLPSEYFIELTVQKDTGYSSEVYLYINGSRRCRFYTTLRIYGTTSGNEDFLGAPDISDIFVIYRYKQRSDGKVEVYVNDVLFATTTGTFSETVTEIGIGGIPTSTTLFTYWDGLSFSWDGAIAGSTKKINAYVGYSALKNSWDHKLNFLTNEAITGIVQWGTASDPDLSDWDLVAAGSSVISITNKNNSENVMYLQQDNGDMIEYDYATATGEHTHEFRVYFTLTTKNLEYSNRDSLGNFVWSINFDIGGNIDFIGTTTDSNTDTYSVNGWIDLKVVWTKNASLKLYKNNVLTSTLTAQNRDASRIRCRCYTNLSEWWIDGIGISQNKYVIESNNEFPLLTFEKPWFATGDADTGIMQLALKDYSTGTRKALVQTEIYKAPECSLNRTTEPFTDEWVKLFSDIGKHFYGGKVKDNNNDFRFMWIYLMKSWQDEFSATKINELLTDYNYKDMWEFILDKYSKYLWYGPGTNGDVLNFVSGLTGWTISGADANETATYFVQKAFLNGFMYNTCELWDNDAASNLDVYRSGFSGTVVSLKIATTDVSKTSYWYIKEVGTNIVTLYFLNSKIQINGGGTQIILDPAVNNTIYHIVLDFKVSADTVDVYINGVFISNENLENNITTEISQVVLSTNSGNSGYYNYTAEIYVKNSLVDAFHTYSSISPLLTTTQTFDLKSQSLIGLQKSMAKETGYILSVRSTGQVYIDQYGASGKSINANESQGITFMSLMKIRNEKFSYILFYGGFVNGVQIESEGFSEPNFGNYEDWFPEINGKDSDDIYYDSDGNPKSYRLDAKVTTALANSNITIKKQTMGKRGIGMIEVGTSLTYNNTHYKISSETWNAWRKNIYNGKTDDNRVEIADSYLSSDKSDPEDDPLSQVTKLIDVNAENIVKVGQNVGYLAERIRCLQVLPMFVEKNQRNLDENVWGFFNNLSLANALDSVNPINDTAGCHRILLVINAGSDLSGTITITGNTRDRTDTTSLTVADTEDIVISALTTDNTSLDSNGNTIHEYDNVYMTDKWFEGAIVISTTDVTLTDVDVFGCLYHQFDSYKLITLNTLDFTGKCTNTAAWFNSHFYVITSNGSKAYDINDVAPHEITAAISDANEGYRRRKVINQLIDGNAGDGVWLEIFFGPAASAYWEDVSIYLTALLDNGTD